MKRYRLQSINLENAQRFHAQITSLQSEGGFVNRVYGLSPQEFRRWLTEQERPDRSGLVPQNLYALCEGQTVYGMGTLYRHLNEPLSQAGGHISYGILPRYRGRRLAHLLLHLLVGEAKALGIERPLLTIFDHNTGSRRVAEKAGGILVRRTPGWLYYEMDTAAARIDGRIAADLQRRFGLRVHSAEPLLGGGVNTKWVISTGEGSYLVKQYSAQRYSEERLQRVKETFAKGGRRKSAKRRMVPLMDSGQGVFLAARQVSYSIFGFAEQNRRDANRHPSQKTPELAAGCAPNPRALAR